MQDYQAKQKDSVIDSIYKSGWLDKGYTVAQANAILELQKAKGMSAILSKDEIDSALRNLKIIEEQQEREDKLTEAKRKQTQEIEKQAKLTKRLVCISGHSGIVLVHILTSDMVAHCQVRKFLMNIWLDYRREENL
ncbi:hypothetical protein KHAB170019_11580 [Acinetobacter baumannii]|nr:hypothetical protein KHAB170019_11580 [Acinetobacter baumannii]